MVGVALGYALPGLFAGIASAEVAKVNLVVAVLAHGTRLDAFRLLVEHEPDGLPAGEVAKALGIPQNSMSVHLVTLPRAGLIRSERRSRVINYHADLDQLKVLMLFLVKDCCGGNAELCAPLIAELAPCC